MHLLLILLLFNLSIDLCASIKDKHKSKSATIIATKILSNDYTDLDLQIGQEVISLASNLQKDKENEGQVNLVIKKIEGNKNFQVFAPLLNKFKYIYRIKKLDEYFAFCGKNSDVKTEENSIEKFFNKIFQQRCLRLFFDLTQKNLYEHEKIQNYLSNNINDFVFSKYIAQLINLAISPKIKSSLKMHIINLMIDAYIKTGNRPHELVFKKIPQIPKLSSYLQLLELKSQEENSEIHVILKKMSQNIREQVNSSEINNEVISLNVVEILNFAQIHYTQISNPRSWFALHMLGKTLANHQHFLDASKIFEFNLSIAAKNKDDLYETIFALVWIDISQNKYSEAANKIELYKLQRIFSELPSKLKFWIAYTLNEIGNDQKAKKYFRSIIKENPISYYSIISSKILSNISHLTLDKNHNIIKESLESHSVDLLLNQQFYTEKFSQGLFRLRVWSKLENNLFINMETRLLMSFKKADVYSNNNHIGHLTDIEFSKNLTSIVSQVLAEKKRYLDSFANIYSAMAKNIFSPDKAIIETLFPKPFHQDICPIAKGIDPFLILSLIRQESAFNPHAISRAGAVGLMQLLPSTARTFQKVTNKQLRDPKTNLKIGIRYLSYLFRKYGGNVVYVLSAYNAGERNVGRWSSKHFKQNKILHTIESIPYLETKLYVQLIIRNIFFYKLLNQTQDDSGDIDKIFDFDLKFSPT